MKDTAKRVSAFAGTAVLVGGMGVASAVAFADAPDLPVEPAIADTSAETGSAWRSVANVEGTFSFTQGEAASAAEVARAMGDTPRYLCSSDFQGIEQGAVDANDWVISVGGDVDNAFTATMAELEEGGSAQVTMGCSCAGNPADGLASVNAGVQGITIESIIERAGAYDANTIVFTSADGYEVALPLNYVAQRYSMIVFSLDGGELADSIGGVNQLWLGSTSARYFVRDVNGITFEQRENPPAAPGTAEAGDAYANVPNIGVVYGGVA